MKKKIIIILLCVAAVGTAVWYFFFKKPETPNNTAGNLASPDLKSGADVKVVNQVKNPNITDQIAIKLLPQTLIDKGASVGLTPAETLSAHMATQGKG